MLDDGYMLVCVQKERPNVCVDGGEKKFLYVLVLRRFSSRDE